MRGKVHRERNASGMKAVLTSGALAALLGLWVMFAAPEQPAEETAEASPEPLPPTPALELEPLPTLVPAPDRNSSGTPRAVRSSKAPPRQRVSSPPALRSVQAPPPPAPRVLRVPAPSNSRPAAVTQSSR